jgi:rhodanese-related sulfurtransferase
VKNKHLFVTIMVLGLLLSTVGTLAAQSSDFDVVQTAAADYLGTVSKPVISADALWENLNDGDTENDPFILSVRAPEDYEKGHIPGAINISWKQIADPDNLDLLPTDQQIVVYCYTGHTGQLATTLLNLMGYDAINLKFGMMGWTENDEVFAKTRFGPDTAQRDYRIETEVNEATETYDYPDLDTGGADDAEIVRLAADNWVTEKTPLIQADALWENLSDGDTENDPIIVSVRSAEDYEKGHIPGAINIPWKAIADPENLAMLPPDQPIVVYCYTGHTGQVATTILVTLGYDASNLVYGMMGWTEDDEVLATDRFSPSLQRDYTVEGTAADAGSDSGEDSGTTPPVLPETGAAPIWVLVLPVAGAGMTLAGLALRRRRGK